jgi:cytochrome c peroxidase
LIKKIIIFFLPLFLFSSEPITPIYKIPYNKEKAQLGKKLFFDKSISADGTISCASCHELRYGSSDPRPVSVGVYGKLGIIQSTPIYNAVFNFRQFWNGRARNLYEQIDGPIHNPAEMGLNSKRVEKILNDNSFYKKEFTKIYHKNHITYDMFKDAIVEFEKAMVTLDSKFDRYLKGKVKLTKKEKKGYLLFKKFGCITCHNGVNVGGNSFQKMGVVYKIKNRIGDRYEVTKDLDDKFVYKVPSLRNIELTAPYFHNAVTYDLHKAVALMAYHNLGIIPTKEEIDDIVAFLKTLTGKKPKILENSNE